MKLGLSLLGFGTAKLGLRLLGSSALGSSKNLSSAQGMQVVLGAQAFHLLRTQGVLEISEFG